jgi:hypothetical protein
MANSPSISFRLPAEMFAKVRVLAREKDLTNSQTMVEILAEYLAIRESVTGPLLSAEELEAIDL